MGIEKGSWCCWGLVMLWPSLLLLTEGAAMSSSEADNKTCTSSGCGIIANISYPFRLRGDPPHCGDLMLSCENNVTLLHSPDYYLNSGTYRVLGINYSNYTIRLVEEGIQEGNCSSLPLSSLSLSDFVDYQYPVSASTRNYDGAEPILSKQVGYLECSNPVTDDAAYVDTAPCVKGGGHLYAVAGDLRADQLKPWCHLKSLTLMASDRDSMVLGGGIKSYTDIHSLLSHGFELSWMRRACDDLGCPYDTPCHFLRKTHRLQCLPVNCGTLSGIFSICWMPELRRVAEDYIYGIQEGLLKIVGKSDPLVFNIYSHFSTSNIVIPSGIVTGRFVLPIMTARFLFGIIFLIVLLVYACRRRHLSVYENIEDFIRLHNLHPLRYSYKDLKIITQGFRTKLGQGGFGTVYRGRLKSGIDVAVKMLGSAKANGQEFINEVATIGRIHHFNVVRLVGFCVEGTKRALIYEFMPNGSLDRYIFSKREGNSLSYKTIYEISLGVARGIAYLHHGCDMQILHFDIKPHNILLDDKFTPKVSDFGLARLYTVNNSIVSLTAARGTIGYMAPELFYKNIGGVSHKADVYSFGMLLMEMTSQRRNLNPHAEHSSQLYFPLWIYDQFDEERDLEMEGLTKEEKDFARKMFIVALWCIQLKPLDRPSMNRVIQMLEANNVESLKMPPKPSLYPNERVLINDGSSSYQTTSTVSTDSHI